MKNKTIGSSFDDFLEAEGIKEAVEAGAIKKLSSFQLLETIKKENLTKTVQASCRKCSTANARTQRIFRHPFVQFKSFSCAILFCQFGKRLCLP